jgi:hypothetical protein
LKYRSSGGRFRLELFLEHHKSEGDEPRERKKEIKKQTRIKPKPNAIYKSQRW